MPVMMLSRTEVVGWAHEEDLSTGLIGWHRHDVNLSRRDEAGGILIADSDHSLLVSSGEIDALITHPSPRDLIATLLLDHPAEWGRHRHLPPGATYHDDWTGADQDYVWRDRWTQLPAMGHVHIGDDVWLSRRHYIGIGTLGATTIGDGCRIGECAHIGHDARIGEHTLVLAHAVIGGWARIGSHVKICIGATVRNGIAIGDGATIGMGAVVLEDVPAGETWAGNPARRLR